MKASSPNNRLHDIALPLKTPMTICVDSQTPQSLIKLWAQLKNVTLNVTALPDLWDLPERMACSIRSDNSGVLVLPRQIALQNLIASNASAVYANQLISAHHIAIRTAGIFEAFKLKYVQSYSAFRLPSVSTQELDKMGAMNLTFINVESISRDASHVQPKRPSHTHVERFRFFTTHRQPAPRGFLRHLTH